MIPAREAIRRPEPPRVDLADLQIGELLAEGGEGQVFQLPRQPHMVYKAYRRAGNRQHLPGLVAWIEGLEPGPLRVVHAATAWPTTVVEDQGRISGLLLPRAPRRFALRHRDGQTRLASLSYLTADPGHRSAAYGLALPDPASPPRLGLVLALARVLAAFESSHPAAGPGDLSTKNVLRSLHCGPEVYVLDCDNAELFDCAGGRFDASGPGRSPEGRRRAMTPNWDDPAVERGSNPTRWTDRYSLALIFLRVVGAANFPIQARQRSGEPVDVPFPVPQGSATSRVLGDPRSPLWALCARGLSSADPPGRPSPLEWVAALEQTLEGAGATATADAVRAQQAGWVPAAVAHGPAAPRPADPSLAPADPSLAAAVRTAASDVTIRPELRAWDRPAWSKVSPLPRYGRGGAATAATAPPPLSPAAGGLAYSPVAAGSPSTLGSRAGSVSGGRSGSAPSGGPASVPAGGAGPATGPEIRAQIGRVVRAWLHWHATAVRMLWRGPSRWGGAGRLAGCLALDVLILLILGGLVGVLIAPLLGL